MTILSKVKLGHICAVLAHNIATVMQSNTNLGKKKKKGYSCKTPKCSESNANIKVLPLLQFIAVDKMEKNLCCGHFRLAEIFLSSSIMKQGEKKKPQKG